MKRPFSEERYAKLVAKRFHTEHTTIRLKPEDMLRFLPEALQAMDHPSVDGPNTWVVSKVTKEAGITMALSGLGGDELFAGYEVFSRTLGLLKNWITAVPKPLRAMAGAAGQGCASHSGRQQGGGAFEGALLRHRGNVPALALGVHQLRVALFRPRVEAARERGAGHRYRIAEQGRRFIAAAALAGFPGGEPTPTCRTSCCEIPIR